MDKDPYDRKGGGNDLLPRQGDSPEELRRLTGISKADSDNWERDEQAKTNSDVAQREQVAAGKGPGVGGMEHGATGLGAEADEDTSGAQASNRSELNRQEQQGGLFNSSDDEDEGGGKPGKGLGGRLMLLKNNRKNLSIALVFLVTGGGFASTLASLTAGPLSIMDLGSMADEANDSSNQTESRVAKLFRYVNYYQKGHPENAKLNWWGRHAAPAFDLKMANAGIVSKFTNGGLYYEGYIIDPAKVKGGDFANMTAKEREPTKFAEFMERTFKAKATVQPDGKVLVNWNAFRGRLFYRFTGSMLKSMGTGKVVSAILKRTALERSGQSKSLWRLGTIDKAYQDALKKGVINPLDQVRKDWLEARNERINRSARAPGIKSDKQTQTDEEGKPIPNEQTDSVNDDINDTSKEAGEAHGDQDKRGKLNGKLAAKLAGGGLGALAVLCILFGIHEDKDNVQLANIQKPLIAFKTEWDGAKGTIENGMPDFTNIDAHQIDWLAEELNDKQTKTDAYDSEVVHAYQGKPGGVPVPEQIKTNSSGGGFGSGVANDVLDAIFNDEVTTVIKPICQVLEGPVGLILLAASFVFAFPSTLVQFIALPKIIAAITDYLTADNVNVNDLVGPAKAAGLFFGGRHANNAQMEGLGALPLDTTTGYQVQQDNYALHQEEFESKSLSYRMFSPTDPRSFMGQIMQQQSTDPGQNFANYVGSFMNIGRNFGSLFGRQLQLATVGAAPLPYDYGFPLVAYDPAVLENPAYDNPYENAERATALLDGENGEAYVDWAKDCFGISFVKQETEDPDNPDAEPETLWAVEPPKANTIQTYKKLNSDDCKGANIGMNNSTLTTADGRDLSVRKAAATDNMNVISIFGMDSQLMAGACCYNCAENSQIGTKACEDIGMSNRGGGGGKGGGPGPLSKLPWISGVHTANEIDVNEAFGTWRGRPIDFLNTFSINWGAPSWSQMEEPFLMDEYSAFEAKGGSVDLSVPLVLDSYNQGTMQACANGANDASWQKFANSIVNHNMNSAQTIVRLGWEFNGDDGFVGNASNGPSFKSCYAHVSTVIRGIATDVLMDWTPMGGHGGPNLVENFFPGPEYADIIGVDWYDEYGIHDQASFDSACNNASNQGPCYYAEKAREMGIKFAVGEWGIVMNSGGDGDNPSYIEGMLNMFNDNADVLAYESYYNAAGAIEPTNKRSGIWPLGGNAGNIDAPQAGARYKEMMSDGTFPTL